MHLTRRQRDVLFQLAYNKSKIVLHEGIYTMGGERLYAGVPSRLVEAGFIAKTWQSESGDFIHFEITKEGKSYLEEKPTSPEKPKSQRLVKKKRRSTGRKTNAWHQKHDDEIIRERKEGKSISSIAKKHKCTIKTLYVILHEAGLVKKYQYTRQRW